ncbi:P protein [Drosophila guanche]|uniref:Blast:P protein n=1 Tax=Drosophila guanche TaxID=7266 RepID=A0A3B0KBK5_DROGU|nr:P protein [Drosophila guanche]SPP82431.1 blast:P protein [Drosophila guanche]
MPSWPSALRKRFKPLLNPPTEEEKENRRKLINRIYLFTKLGILILLWLFFTITLATNAPEEVPKSLVTILPNQTLLRKVGQLPHNDAEIRLEGRIDEDLMGYASVSDEVDSVGIRIERRDSSLNVTYVHSDMWNVYIKKSESKYGEAQNHFKVPVAEGHKAASVVVSIKSYSEEPVSFVMQVDTKPVDTTMGVVYAGLLLIFLYILIIWEITDRTFAALMVSSATLAVLAAMGARPSLQTIVSWIDFDTLMLLLGMMIMVAILSETGVFDYLAVCAYRMASGNVWPLIFFLCIFTGIMSAFLDNVTMVLLMVPVTIRLCEVMAVRTTLVLIVIVLYSNIGGTLTPVGDPPNVIIATDSDVEADGIDFFTFTLHMFPGVFICMFSSFFLIYFMIRHKLRIPDVDPMTHAIQTLEREAEKVSPTTADEDELREDILERIEELKARARARTRATIHMLSPVDNYYETLAALELKYSIRNKPLLIKCCIALGFAIALFFLHSLPWLAGASLAWIAMLAALLLLILANKEAMDAILLHVEWSTLLFFAALFVMIEAMSELGLIQWIGDITVGVILRVDESNQMTVAIMMLIWITALTSAFVDNIPITQMMLKLTVQLAKNKMLNLPMAPLIWALSFGACFGGNGTLIGASANVVTAGLAHQHGFKISFVSFFIVGFPVMIFTVVIASIYLLIAHSLFSWHKAE